MSNVTIQTTVEVAEMLEHKLDCHSRYACPQHGIDVVVVVKFEPANARLLESTYAPDLFESERKAMLDAGY